MNGVTELREDGITILRDFIPEGQLYELQLHFKAAVEPLSVEADQKFVIPSRWLDVSAAFQILVKNRVILEMAADYLGHEPVMAEFSGRRLLPYAPERPYGAFQYHHDTVGTQVKAMLLLTDVGSEDQRMTYIAGSHRRLWENYGRYEETRFSEEAAHRYLRPGEEPIEAIGPAGTMIVFDTNGLHAGRRNRGAVRDTITTHYR